MQAGNKGRGVLHEWQNGHTESFQVPLKQEAIISVLLWCFFPLYVLNEIQAPRQNRIDLQIVQQNFQ